MKSITSRRWIHMEALMKWRRNKSWKRDIINSRSCACSPFAGAHYFQVSLTLKLKLLSLIFIYCFMLIIWWTVFRDCSTQVTHAVEISYIWTMGPFFWWRAASFSPEIALDFRLMGKKMKKLPVSDWLRLSIICIVNNDVACPENYAFDHDVTRSKVAIMIV